MTIRVHLVYIHGFQGNDTTFQSFPTDLQNYLTPRIPSGKELKIQSSLYPTYKSVKPISFATKNFLEWLSTQPEGPVILMGHSMGGLLAADAACHPSNNPDPYPGSKPQRIIGMVAFDTPYLGMHPHVVVSGIASLFAKDHEDVQESKNNHKTESEMNDHADVHMVDEKVTGDWDAFKKDLDPAHAHTSIHSNSRSSPLPSPSLRPPYSPSHSQYGLPPSPLVDRAVSFLSTVSNDPVVRWVRKHSDEPFLASKRWIVEHFQFGICMFDPGDLKDRYTRLVAWNGLWVNYWTQTVPRKRIEGEEVEEEGEERKEEEVADDDMAILETGIPDMSLELTSNPPTPDGTDTPEPVAHGPPTKSEAKSIAKAREKELKRIRKEREAEVKAAVKQQKINLKKEKGKEKEKVPRHFIVLPTGLGRALGGGDKWEKVLIGGVDDEVAAHTGLFIPGQNLDYEGLVERVGTKILDWCEKAL